MSTKVRPATASGGRKLSDEHRRKLSESNKAKFAALTPEQKAAQVARLAGGRKPRAPSDPPPADNPPAGGRVNPLAMTPLELVRSIRDRRRSGADQ